MVYDCIIAGAGASGLFCASSFPNRIKGLILEKTRRAGTKLLMSGGGQCNITHSGSIKDFIPKYGKNGGKIRGCLYKYNNLHLQTFLKENGIPTITREDGKVFPKSMEARQILNMLLNKSEDLGFALRFNEPVIGVRKNADKNCWQVDTPADSYLCRTLVIASGGFTYPSTGSDGSVFRVLKESPGLTVTPLRPALAPVYVENYPYTDLSGIAFETAGLQVLQKKDGNEKLFFQNSGALLFTHENFSGPLILNSARYICPGDTICLNYLYPLSREQALEKIKNASNSCNMRLSNLLAKELALPGSFTDAITKTTGESLKAAALKLTADTFTVSKLGGQNKAMVTAGGIALSEIVCKTMECKNHPGLYIIGEALDIDGETGGYNLQFAYSSACTAASAITNTLRKEI